jgi:hypothetical protein
MVGSYAPGLRFTNVYSIPLLSWKDSKVLAELLEYPNLEFTKIY